MSTAPEHKAVLELGDGKARIVKGAEIVSKALGHTASLQELSLVEAAYLLYTGTAVILDKNGTSIGFRELIKEALRISPYAWVLFEVFYDLRRRGKIVVPGPRSHSLLLRKSKRASTYTTYILVLEENRKIDIETLLSFIEEARHNSWEPIVAIVDRYGDITYYSMRTLYPRNEKQQN